MRTLKHASLLALAVLGIGASPAAANVQWNKPGAALIGATESFTVKSGTKSATCKFEPASKSTAENVHVFVGAWLYFNTWTYQGTCTGSTHLELRIEPGNAAVVWNVSGWPNQYSFYEEGDVCGCSSTSPWGKYSGAFYHAKFSNAAGSTPSQIKYSETEIGTEGGVAVKLTGTFNVTTGSKEALTVSH